MAVPPIQNVVEEAQRANTAPPVRWGTITWLYRGEESKRCADAGKAWLANGDLRLQSRVVELPSALRAVPGNIELWLPSSATAQ